MHSVPYLIKVLNDTNEAPVVRHEAAEARRLGESLTAQLNRIETLGDAEKDTALKAYTVVSTHIATALRRVLKVLV